VSAARESHVLLIRIVNTHPFASHRADIANNRGAIKPCAVRQVKCGNPVAMFSARISSRHLATGQSVGRPSEATGCSFLFFAAEDIVQGQFDKTQERLWR
jgi:hypothetical protein